MRLKELSKLEMISKQIDSSAVPISSTYILTPKGKDFIKIIKDIKKWALKWNINNKLCRKTDCKDCKF